MRKILLGLLVAAAFWSPCFADSQGSATGGTPGTQSTGAGCINQSPTLSSGQQATLACDSSGNLKTTAMVGTITAVTTVGTITNPVGVKGADGSTISGPTNPVSVSLVPSATVGVTTQSCTVACASTIVSGAHSAYGISGSATVTGTILVYDATSCAANGTVTPKKSFAYTVANSPIGISWSDTPMVNATGIAVCFSSTGPYTATASTTAFLSLDYK